MMFIAFLVAAPGIFFVLRFIVYYALGQGSGHVQSLVLSGALFALAGILAMGGILADLVAINRFLLEDLRTRALRAEIDEIILRTTASNEEVKYSTEKS